MQFSFELKINFVLIKINGRKCIGREAFSTFFLSLHTEQERSVSGGRSNNKLYENVKKYLRKI